jgi:hypothetical protein
MVEAVLREQDELAAMTNVVAVPFVDTDGVAEGDQGKNRSPRDHARDYFGQSLYPETATIRTEAPGWSEGRPLVVFDLHCPGSHGAKNEAVYVVGAPDPEMWRAQQRFSDILESVNLGPLPYRVVDNLPFGTSWNIERNFAKGMPVVRWAATAMKAPLTVSMEIPYANAAGVTVEPDGARCFGHALAHALAIYLREK